MHGASCHEDHIYYYTVNKRRVIIQAFSDIPVKQGYECAGSSAARAAKTRDPVKGTRGIQQEHINTCTKEK